MCIALCMSACGCVCAHTCMCELVPVGLRVSAYGTKTYSPCGHGCWAWVSILALSLKPSSTSMRSQ